MRKVRASRWVVSTGCLLLGWLAACSTPQTSAILDDKGGLPPRAEVAEVPFIPQKEYFCGPAALGMALTWSGLPVSQEDLVDQVYTPSRRGTLRNDMLAAARRHGRLAVPVPTLRAVLAEIAAGSPVLVFQNLALDWYPQWHYAVAFGYDLDSREILLHSGLDERHVSAMSTFERTWGRGDNWALVILPPDRLPASADEPSVLQAAVALERVGRLREAATAYGAIAKRWPRSLAAYVGLGNALYGLDDLDGAERALREGVRRHSDVAALWNNLAHVLAAQGRRDEALVAARKAVALDPRNEQIYRDTLRELSRKES